jgi:MoxR-like ATPase
MTPPPPADVATLLAKLRDNVAGVFLGKPEVVRLALVALLADGHLLLEDVPGVGKTLLGKAVAKSLGCSFQRVQFTPDLLPADLTGSSVFHPPTGKFEFVPGPVFAQVVLADEINRATPRHPVGPARSDGRAAGHGGRHHPPARPAVPRAGHAKPLRV